MSDVSLRIFHPWSDGLAFSELLNMSIRAYEIYPVLCQLMPDCNPKCNVVPVPSHLHQDGVR